MLIFKLIRCFTVRREVCYEMFLGGSVLLHFGFRNLVGIVIIFTVMMWHSFTSEVSLVLYLVSQRVLV